MFTPTLMWTPGVWEIVLVLLVVLLLFGPSKLPQLGGAVGKALTNFKRGMRGEDEIDVTPEQGQAEPQEKIPEQTAQKAEPQEVSQKQSEEHRQS